jgi:aminoglycoside phosphotransferase (APT) family kinase protein
MADEQSGAESSIPPDVIPIRPDENFDQERLAAYLSGRLPGTERALAVQQFGGGHANLTYLLRYGDMEYVLRRPPLGSVATTAHDMGREYRVLSVLYKAYPLAPRAYLYCEDTAVIGTPFFVMERRHGTVVRRAIPPEFGGGRDAAQNRRISEVLIDALADLHDVDPAAAGLGDLGRPEGFLTRQVEGWVARYERARTKAQPVVTEVTAWLRDQLPASPPPTLLHNDWRLDNMMLDCSDPGRVVAVFDWDMCTRGDPLADVGTLMASWVEQGEGLDRGAVGSMPSAVPGFLTRREAIERYCRRRGIDPTPVPYYLVFGLFKMGVVLQQLYHRYHLGQTLDQRFAPLEQVAEVLFEHAKARMHGGEV